MRILLITQYFAPERTAASLRLAPLAASLADRGHEVDVVCERPSYPEGVVYEGFEGRPFSQARVEGYRVRRVWTWARPSKGPAARLASYGSFTAAGGLAAVAGPRPDVVVASSPPLTVGLVGAVAAVRFRVPWVLDVRDLWLDAAVSLGELPATSPFIVAARRLERGLYDRAAAITVPSAAYRDRPELQPHSSKVHLVPNGASEAALEAGGIDVSREEADLPTDRFVWMYAGNVGLSQDLGTAIAAAGELGESFKLVILGDGASRPALELEAAGLPAGTVEFRDPIDVGAATRAMRASDALLVPLVDDPIQVKTIPVKLYDAAAVGRPVVLAATGESRRLADEAGAALAVPPGSPVDLAAAIRRLRDEPELRSELSSRARAFGLASSRSERLSAFERALDEVT